ARAAPVALPQDAQDVVERARRPREEPDLEVEKHGDELPLLVVADGRVPGVLVALVELDPRVPARVAEALAQAARRVEERAQVLGLELEVTLARHEPGAREQELVVVGGEALDEPEVASVDLLVVVERPERQRTDPLPVPQVEVLVREER